MSHITPRGLFAVEGDVAGSGVNGTGLERDTRGLLYQNLLQKRVRF